jgi:urease accessory protein
MKRSLILGTIAAAVTATPALAHTGAGPASGLIAGFGHPVGGLDHILAMVAVGILATRLGGKSVWTVPAAFVGMMLVGGLAGLSGISMPFVEIGIAGSVVVLGIVIAAGRKLPMTTAMAMVGVMAIFHGHAHGTEMPLDANGLQYAAGFAIATALLHAAGLAIGLGAEKIAARFAPTAIRTGGALIAAAGATLLAT